MTKCDKELTIFIGIKWPRHSLFRTLVVSFLTLTKMCKLIFSARRMYKLQCTVSGWYRFQSSSYTKMLDQCVSPRKCLTVVTGFLNGLHPLIEDGIVDREACFHGHSNCCHRKVKIHVRRCDGFYVYYLNPSPAGLFRYCAI